MTAKFAVAAGHDVTASAAADILRAGGNAVDAVIAATLASAVAEPVLSSLLAGGFLMVSPADSAPVLLDAFVQTPKRKRPLADQDLRQIEVDFGETQQTFHCGAGTTATPGIVPGIFEAHARFGRMPMDALVQPAIRVAREGCMTTAFNAEVLGYVRAIFTSSEGARALYAPKGRLLGEGDLLKNPETADVLETLAIEGARFVQEGEIAQGLVSLEGCHLTMDDMVSYRPVWRNPLNVSRGNAQLFLNPAPSLGGAQIALALSALPHDPDDELIARCLYRIACIRRDHDLDHHPHRAEDILLDAKMVAGLRKTLTDHQAATRGTTHISVLDAQGMGASMTLSNGEGNGLIIPGTGLMANNMLGEDDLVPDGPNSWREDTRLASMMCPSVIRQGADQTLLGSGGSNRIRSALATTMIGLLDRGEDLYDAIHAPRLHVEAGTDNILDFELSDSEARTERLKSAFPNANAWGRRSMFFGGVHAVRAQTARGYTAAGDPRRSGAALTE